MKILVAEKRVKSFRRKDSNFTPNDLIGVACCDFHEEDVEGCEQDEDIYFSTYRRMCTFGGMNVVRQFFT